MIQNINDTKKYLYEANRTYNQRRSWDQLFLQNDLSGQLSNAAVTENASSAIGDAYASSFLADDVVTKSNLGEGFKEKLMTENNNALYEAYNTYSANLKTAQGEISDSVYNNAVAIDDLATTQATNVNAYRDAHFEYLEHLYESEPDLFKSAAWSKYLTNDTNETDDASDDYSRLMTRAELIDAANKDGDEYRSLYDENGNLTLRGIDFYDQVENAKTTGNTFGNFIDENHADLGAWMETKDMFNATLIGNNASSFREMVGMESTDQTYSFIERFGGLTKTEVDSMFAKYKAKSEEFGNAIAKKGKDKAASYTTEIQGLVGELKTMATDLGIENNMGFDFDTFTNLALEAVEKSKTGDKMTQDFFVNFIATGLGVATAIGASGAVVAGGAAAAGATLGGATAATGGTALLVMLAAGVIAGTVTGANAVNEDRKANQAAANDARDAYDQLLVAMTMYAKAQQSKAQAEFNNKF